MMRLKRWAGILVLAPYAFAIFLGYVFYYVFM